MHLIPSTGSFAVDIARWMVSWWVYCPKDSRIRRDWWWERGGTSPYFRWAVCHTCGCACCRVLVSLKCTTSYSNSRRTTTSTNVASTIAQQNHDDRRVRQRFNYCMLHHKTLTAKFAEEKDIEPNEPTSICIHLKRVAMHRKCMTLTTDVLCLIWSPKMGVSSAVGGFHLRT